MRVTGSSCFIIENCQCQENPEWKRQALCQRKSHSNLNKLKLWESWAILENGMEFWAHLHCCISYCHIYFVIYAYEMSLYKTENMTLEIVIENFLGKKYQSLYSK